MNLRELIKAQVEPLLPAKRKWRVIPYQDNLDVVDAPTAMFKIKTIVRTPEAPRNNHTVTFVMTVIEPTADSKRGEDLLGVDIDDFLFALDTVKNLVWTKAERVVYNASNPAYDIDIEVVTQKEVSK
jgi:hypothetical protein